MEEDLSDEESTASDDTVICDVMEWCIEDDRLCYVCHTEFGEVQTYDRSDLIDGGQRQRLVLAYEAAHPPPWDDVCMYCDGDGCEECVCDECERPCRHINGINYGCVRHPVI